MANTPDRSTQDPNSEMGWHFEVTGQPDVSEQQEFNHSQIDNTRPNEPTGQYDYPQQANFTLEDFFAQPVGEWTPEMQAHQQAGQYGYLQPQTHAENDSWESLLNPEALAYHPAASTSASRTEKATEDWVMGNDTAGLDHEGAAVNANIDPSLPPLANHSKVAGNHPVPWSSPLNNSLLNQPTSGALSGGFSNNVSTPYLEHIGDQVSSHETQLYAQGMKVTGKLPVHVDSTLGFGMMNHPAYTAATGGFVDFMPQQAMGDIRDHIPANVLQYPVSFDSFVNEPFDAAGSRVSQQHVGSIGGHIPANTGQHNFNDTAATGLPPLHAGQSLNTVASMDPRFYHITNMENSVGVEQLNTAHNSLAEPSTANQDTEHNSLAGLSTANHDTATPEPNDNDLLTEADRKRVGWTRVQQFSKNFPFSSKELERAMKHRIFWDISDADREHIIGFSQPPGVAQPNTTFHNGERRSFIHKWTAADEYRNRVQTPPAVHPGNDDTLFEVFGFRNGVNHAEMWVGELYKAMVDMEGIQDSLTSHAALQFTCVPNAPPPYDSKDVEATCIAIMSALLDRCLHGFRGPPHLDKGAKPHADCSEDRDGDCLTRIQNVVDALRVSKKLCADCLWDDKCIRCLVNAPLMSVKEKKSRKRWNDKRRKKAKAEENQDGEDEPGNYQG